MSRDSLDHSFRTTTVPLSATITMLRRLLQSIGWLIALVLAMWLWVHSTQQYYASIAPSMPGLRYSVFREQHEPASNYVLTDSAGNKYLESIAPLPPMWMLPSGAPAYVFDAKGVLVTWTSDSGDDPTYQQRWRSLPRTKLPDLKADPYPL
ncbi:hypothetical protein [Aeoliella mucimassa]|uniref:Uncharacterized protein n=1 Tax=Aeoliella mucimassa TaxID=2527972 RepID=A0A518AIG0_9BACT|nr:hypothetical protein [Aeoliella mucimassa]QDU54518.1 hypothetical protein Pan181_07000 [Aeoliella mucimassa]